MPRLGRPESCLQCASMEPSHSFTHTTLAPGAWRRRERDPSEQFSAVKGTEFGASLPGSLTSSMILDKSLQVSLHQFSPLQNTDKSRTDLPGLDE